MEEALSQQPIERVERVEVMVDSPLCVAFPRKEMENLNVEEVLADAGVPVGPDRRVVIEHSDSPIAYAMSLNKEDVGRICCWAETMGAEVSFRSLLAEVVARAIVGGRHDKCVVVNRTATTLYLAYTTEHRLLYAEALPLTRDDYDEVLYALAVLNGDFELRRADIINIGMRAKESYKVLRRYFRRCSHE